jgi:hypothetical protein
MSLLQSNLAALKADVSILGNEVSASENDPNKKVTTTPSLSFLFLSFFLSFFLSSYLLLPYFFIQFHTVMKTFSSRASVELDRANKCYLEAEKVSTNAIEGFAEDPNSMKPEEFLTLFANFATKWRTAYEDNEKAREAAAKKAEKEVRNDFLPLTFISHYFLFFLCHVHLEETKGSTYEAIRNDPSLCTW